MSDDLIVAQIEGHIGGMQTIIREILLDYVTLEAQADYKVMDSWHEYPFMMCHKMGFSPISTIGLGRF